MRTKTGLQISAQKGILKLPAMLAYPKEGGAVVGQPHVLAQGPNQQRSLAQVMSGQAGKQVVLYLELQAAMQPIQPCWTAPIHGPIHLHAQPTHRLHAPGDQCLPYPIDWCVHNDKRLLYKKV